MTSWFIQACPLTPTTIIAPSATLLFLYEASDASGESILATRRLTERRRPEPPPPSTGCKTTTCIADIPWSSEHYKKPTYLQRESKSFIFPELHGSLPFWLVPLCLSPKADSSRCHLLGVSAYFKAVVLLRSISERSWPSWTRGPTC